MTKNQSVQLLESIIKIIIMSEINTLYTIIISVVVITANRINILSTFNYWLISHSNLIKYTVAAAAAKSLQSCPTLCDPIEGSPPGSPVPGILQARTLEWVTISFSNAWKVKSESEVAQSCPTLSTPWTAAHQALPPMGFSRKEYWSGVPLPSPKIHC